MSATRLICYLDLISPFVYFAWPRARALARARGLELVARPVLFAGLLKHWGQLGPAEIPSKRAFTYATCLRYAAEHELPFTLPARHPFNPLRALRLSMPEVSGPRQHEVITALLELGWVRGGDMEDVDAIAEALEAIGCDSQAMLARSAGDDVKLALRRATEEAIDAGVFGVPSFQIGERLFWGNDQLRYVELHLDGRDPLDADTLAEFVARDGRPR